MTKRVVLLEDGTAEMKGLIGSQGVSLSELLRAGWPVPAGFAVTMECCREFNTRLGHGSTDAAQEVERAIHHLEQHTGTVFGDAKTPLLLSVKPSEVHSNTNERASFLYVGLNDVTVEGLAEQTQDRCYALYCYRSLLQDFGYLVHGIPYELFGESVGEPEIQDELELERIITEHKIIIEVHGRTPFPQDVKSQLSEALGAFSHTHYSPVLVQVMVNGEYGEHMSSESACKTVVDMVSEGLITKEEALLRIEPLQVTEVLIQLSDVTSSLHAGSIVSLTDREEKSECVIRGQHSPQVLAVQRLLEWADEVKSLSVLVNVNHPRDAILARALGAEGIGQCQIEAMLLSPSRLPFVQKMITADNDYERRRGVERLLPMLQADFEQFFEVMDGCPVTIKLLDSAWDERLLDVEADMLDMQIEAIFQAALKSIRQGLWVRPEILIPPVSDSSELQRLRELVDHIADQILGEEKRHCLYKVGTTIEISRAGTIATQMARHADFFSFGALDIRENKNLVEISVVQGKARKPYLRSGVCIEQAANADTIAFCHRIGVDYVSCSPEQVPFARIAAAQAAIRERKRDRNEQNHDISTTA
ncbi:putative PEP-binding protein [Paenibacillus sp. DCT19]|uniref:putative PEP-binding protein n=1 Tax=Paenibacillus sp. DCT19 TaxID=2211212 RepID=UPI0013E2F8D6|nr:putative PEP-binding protein [Paenibacillus sp. DCT19]